MTVAGASFPSEAIMVEQSDCFLWCEPTRQSQPKPSSPECRTSLRVLAVKFTLGYRGMMNEDLDR